MKLPFTRRAVSGGLSETRPRVLLLLFSFAFSLFPFCLAGCQWFVNSADREVYGLIEKRQREALGDSYPSLIDSENVPIHVPHEAYKFEPHPIDLREGASMAAGTSRPASVSSLEPGWPATQPVDELQPRLRNEFGPGGTTRPAPPRGTDRRMPMEESPFRSGASNSASPAESNLNSDSSPLGLARRRRAAASQAASAPEGRARSLDSPPLADGFGTRQPASTRPAAGRPVERVYTAPTQPAPGMADVTASAPGARVLSLADSLAYAFSHSREFQTQKEDLYLTALALTLERHLWTPQLTGQLQTRYANYGEIRNFDHAMAATATVSAAQRLPLGGQVTASIIDNLMRDLTHHVTTAETGNAIIEANIPLLRGAGLPALETLFQAERNLIYAVRNLELFRQRFSVSIAGDYFALQERRQAIVNAHESVKSLTREVARARALWRTGKQSILDVQRADQQRLGSWASEIDAVESYRSALDAFKIRIGMPTEEPIEVEYPKGVAAGPETQPASQPAELAIEMPALTEDEAIRIATKYRLDLLNLFDQIDDAARGVDIAENNLLPDLTASGSVNWYTNPNELGSWEYSHDRTTFRGALTLELPLDRYKERNALRSSLILKRRAERTYVTGRDTVAAQVRQAIRRVQQQQDLLQVQVLNATVAMNRRTAAGLRVQLGLADNRDIVEAESQLLDARNALASAQAELQLAILQFRRDTGTLLVDDQGRWQEPPGAMSRGPAPQEPVAMPGTAR